MTDSTGFALGAIAGAFVTLKPNPESPLEMVEPVFEE